MPAEPPSLFVTFGQREQYHSTGGRGRANTMRPWLARIRALALERLDRVVDGHARHDLLNWLNSCVLFMDVTMSWKKRPRGHIHLPSGTQDDIRWITPGAEVDPEKIHGGSSTITWRIHTVVACDG